MLNNLISSLVAFLIALVPTSLIPNNNSIDNQTTILFTGDIMLGRSVMGASLDNNDSYYPFRKTADFLKSADITFANLENPIINNCPRHVGGFKFCTSPEIARGLLYSGIDIVSLANNHSENYGKEGFEQTKKNLTNMNIDYIGDNNLVVKEIKNTKFGFLGFNYTFGFNNLDRDLALIAGCHPAIDICIVGVHWGEEYKAVASSMQQAVSRKMIESGADIVIGHHPHWVQNNEIINGKPVYYSLGNFVFDQMWSEETKKGLVVKITFDPPNGETGAKIIKTEEFKTYIPKIGQPVLQDGV